MAEELMTTGQVAHRFNVQLWQLNRMYAKKLLPTPVVVGRNRLVRTSDLPEFEAALREAGYVK